MNPYHKRFNHLHPKLIKTTQNFFRAKPFKASAEAKLGMFRAWLGYASEVYGVDTPHLAYHPDGIRGMTGGGVYSPAFESIAMCGTLSVTTLFHEYRHHLQAKGVVTVTGDQIEDDARAWSLSLFHTVRPRLFAKSVKAGKILFITAEDLATKGETK